MTDQRVMVLNNIRGRLNVDLTDPQPEAVVRRRLEKHPRNTVPSRGRGSQEELIAFFEKMLTAMQGSVARVGSFADVPRAVSQYLNVAPVDICINGEVEEMELPWETEPDIHLVPWVAKSSQGTSVTGCLAAAAETGTVVVASSALNPLTLNFLVERHIVILPAERILGSYEDVWDRVRATGRMPRDITFVSGPSCTGDIEMMLEYGAHGPRALHVVIVNERPPDARSPHAR